MTLLLRCALPCAEGSRVAAPRWSFPPVPRLLCARPLRLRPAGWYALAAARVRVLRFAGLVPVTGSVLSQCPPETSRLGHRAHDALSESLPLAALRSGGPA